MIKRKSNIIIFIFLLTLIDFYIDSEFFGKIKLGDIAFVLFILYFLIYKYKFKVSNKLLLNIGIYFIYLFILTSLLIIMGTELTYVSYFYIIKELIYMSTFFITIESNKLNYSLSKNIILIMIILNLVHSIISIIRGNITHYGVASIESNSPSESGIIFLTCMIISYIYLKREKNEKYIFLVMLSCISVVATISRTSILGLISFWVSYVLLYILDNLYGKIKKNKFLKFIFSIIFIIFLILTFNKIEIFEIESVYFSNIINRFMGISKSIRIRKGMSKRYYNEIIGESWIKLLFGQGKGIPEIIFNRTTLGVDNQYTRMIIEMGIVGTLLWINMLISCLKYFKSYFLKNELILLYSVVFMYLIMGLGYEVFQVSKAGKGIWLLFGILCSNNFINEKLKVKKFNSDV